VIERAGRLGGARDWAVVGAALAILLAAILISALWSDESVRRHSEAPVTVTTTTTTTGASDGIMVRWTVTDG
jgi:hypothetical protein